MGLPQPWDSGTYLLSFTAFGTSNPTRLVPSAVAIMPTRYKEPSYGQENSSFHILRKPVQPLSYAVEPLYNSHLEDRSIVAIVETERFKTRDNVQIFCLPGQKKSVH